jgi:RNA polymerase sigma factor CnrH
MTSPNNQADDENTDTALVSSALAGKDKAFTLLMRRYKNPLFRFALRHLGDEDDAEDAVQDAFIAAYNNLHRFNPKYRFSTWVFQITLNKCRDIGRKRKTRSFMQRLTPFVENTIASDGGADNPETLHQSRAALSQLKDQIAYLPDTLKPAFILCALEEKSHKEASEILRLSPKAVELRVYRARQHLKANLKI